MIREKARLLSKGQLTLQEQHANYVCVLVAVIFDKQLRAKEGSSKI